MWVVRDGYKYKPCWRLISNYSAGAQEVAVWGSCLRMVNGEVMKLKPYTLNPQSRFWGSGFRLG